MEKCYSDLWKLCYCLSVVLNRVIYNIQYRDAFILINCQSSCNLPNGRNLSKKIILQN